MSWLQRYHVRLYLHNSIWLLPALSIAAAIVSVALLARVDRSFGWEMNIHPDTARTIMGTVAGSTFTLVVLVSSTVLVSIQLASAQLATASKRSFPDLADQHLAEAADLQGIGGSYEEMSERDFDVAGKPSSSAPQS